jgi:hypothetical protein
VRSPRRSTSLCGLAAIHPKSLAEQHRIPCSFAQRGPTVSRVAESDTVEPQCPAFLKNLQEQFSQSYQNRCGLRFLTDKHYFFANC